MPNLNSPDARIAFRLFFYQFFVVAANVAARTSRDTYLMQGDYKRSLPLLIAVTAIVMYIVVRIQGFFGRGKSPVFIAVAAPLVAAATYVAFLPFAMTGLASVVYFVWTEVVNALLNVQFWILATAVLDMRSGKKFFGLIGAGGAIGGLIAGLALAPLGRQIGVEYFPVAAAAMLALAVVFAIGLTSRELVAGSSTQEIGNTETNWSLRHPFMVKLGLLLVPAMVVATIVDYQFKTVSAAAIPDAAELAAYYGRYYAVLNGLTLVFQIFVTSFFLTRLGLLASLLFLPALLTLFAIPSTFISLTLGAEALPMLLACAYASRLADQTVKFTIYQSAFQLLWLPVPALYKPQLKMSLEAVFKNGVAGFAGLAIAGIALIYPPLPATFGKLQSVISVIGVVFVIWWLFSAFAVRQSYRQHLVAALENRLVDFSADEIEINSPEIRKTIGQALSSHEEGAVAFALDIISHQSTVGWHSELEKLFSRSSPLIQNRILELAEHDDQLLSEKLILELAQSPSEHSIFARIIAARRRYSFSTVTENSEYERMIGLACAALPTEADSTQRLQFQKFLSHEEIETRIAALSAAIHFPELTDIWAIEDNLRHASPEVRKRALEVTRAGQMQILIHDVILNLSDPRTYQGAKLTLAALNPLVVQNELQSGEYFLAGERDMVHGIFRYLADCGQIESSIIILRNLHVADSWLFFTAAKSLDTIARRFVLTRASRNLIEEKINEALQYYASTLKALLDSPESSLLREYYENALAEWLMGACKLAVVGRGLAQIETRFEGRRLKTVKSSEFLELIENSAPVHIKPVLTKVLESKSDEEVLRHLKAYQSSNNSVLGYWQDSGAEWLMWMARLQNDSVKESDSMYPTLEKILLLKSVEMFSRISGEDISRIIQISRELDKPAGTLLFDAGEEGHELFIVLSGQVKIERDGRELAVLKRGEFLGEMALLDNEPRSARATTLTDCKLLSIAQQDFFDVLSGRPEILRAILRLLSGRLRHAIERNRA